MDQPGLVLHLSQWLKQKFVQRLVADRAGLLQTQAAATRTLATVDERLARIEEQIQQQSHAYEQRIGTLTCELLGGEEELRADPGQDDQVKAEMEAARARLVAKGGDEEALAAGSLSPRACLGAFPICPMLHPPGGGQEPRNGQDQHRCLGLLQG